MRTIAWQRFLREPLLHFVVIGGLFFLLHAAANDATNGPRDVILITPERISQIAVEFSGVWKRMPTSEELDGLIEEDVRSEVYYRDALALGLDKGDAIVRRRMRQKMEFLTDTSAHLMVPSAGEVEAFFAENRQAYRREPQLALEQIFLGEAPLEGTVSHALRALRARPATDASTLGQPTRLPARLRLSRPAAIDSVFGKGFYGQVANLPPGMWSGPVDSAYGSHLVRTLDAQPAHEPSLEDVRDSVSQDWRAEKAAEARALDYERRRSRYVVEIRYGKAGGEDGR